MTLQEKIKAKTMSVDEALAKIPDGALIGLVGGALEPQVILKDLHTILDRMTKPVVMYGTGSVHDYEYICNPKYQDKITIWSNFYGSLCRRNHPNGNVSLIPIHLHASMTRFLDVYTPNVVLLMGTAVDKHGYVRCSFGASELLMAEKADLVIAEVNPQIPYVYGENEIHIDDIDCLIEVDYPPDSFEPGPLSEIDIAIGKNVAELVEDGSTIQLGIGAVPDAVARAFMDKKDLGIHTEMLTSSMAELALAGVITGKKKTLHKGKIVGTFAHGSTKLYDFLADNPSVYLMPYRYLNNPCVIAQNYKMCSINTCMEVDLVGQVSSESIGPRQYSGTGGQNDTAEGAIHGVNGKSIIAFPSSVVKKDGTRLSKIKPILTPGAIVTLSRNNIDYLVTEYGVAPMKARTVRQRVDNLIAVAHPDFRAELRAEANRLMLW